MGVASPGALDLVHGLVQEAPQLPGWDGVPLARSSAIASASPCCWRTTPTRRRWARTASASGRGTRYMVYLTISTGVGGGIIIDGKVYHGVTGAAGELGHIIV